MELDLKLLKNLRCLAFGDEAAIFDPVDEAAHIAERGVEIETRVRTFESIEGIWVVYSSIEKITV